MQSILLAASGRILLLLLLSIDSSPSPALFTFFGEIVVLILLGFCFVGLFLFVFSLFLFFLHEFFFLSLSWISEGRGCCGGISRMSHRAAVSLFLSSFLSFFLFPRRFF